MKNFIRENRRDFWAVMLMLFGFVGFYLQLGIIPQAMVILGIFLSLPTLVDSIFPDFNSLERS